MYKLAKLVGLILIITIILTFLVSCGTPAGNHDNSGNLDTPGNGPAPSSGDGEPEGPEW